MLVIGLTGGIGAGKSTAAGLLAQHGAVVVDADKLGHRAYEKHRPAFAQVVAAFGREVVGADGEIDRRALGAKVFGDADAMRRLTDIVWPQILALAKEEIAAARRRGAEVVVLEAAVLLEAGWQSEVDEVWAVNVPAQVAVARASARDGVDAEAVRARIAAQISNEERAAKAHVVIENTGSQQDLARRLQREWQRLREAA